MRCCHTCHKASRDPRDEKTVRYTGAMSTDSFLTGAAMAVEDAAALAEAISMISSKYELQTALNAFQTVRVERANQMQEASLVNGRLLHFPDGPEQQARDAAMRLEVEGRPFTESPNQWSDPVTQAWCFGYDAEEAAAEAAKWALAEERRRVRNREGPS